MTKTVFFSLVKFRRFTQAKQVSHSASLQWDLQVMISDGKHVLRSNVNLHYTLGFVVNGR